MLIKEHEDLRENLAKELQDLCMQEGKFMIILKKQQKAQRNIIKFLRIELGVETIFQIAGTDSLKEFVFLSIYTKNILSM